METFEQTQGEPQEQTSSDPALSGAGRAEQNQHPYSAPEVQRTLGNRALGRWLQTKAQAQAPVADDASELETERVAERVMNAQPHGLPTDDAARTAVTAREPLVPRGGGEPLPARTRDFFEPRFGRDLGDVRVHTGADATDAAKALAARGYAVGNHVVFGAGQFAPGTPAGDRLLAHELAHVVFGAHEPVIHRSGERPLDIKVPDPDEVSGPDIKYLWQNPALRETIYPSRDDALSFFLRTYMEIDLDDPAEAAKIKALTVEQLNEERLKLGQKLAEIEAEIEELEKRRKKAKKVKNPTEGEQAEADADTRRVTELYFRQHKLKEDLEYLPKPIIKKDKKDKKVKKEVLPEGADKRWAAYQYSKYDETGDELTHDEKLARILDRFDADKSFTRYPKWLRYMVIHFSGMRYKSAHGSYAPATEIVKRLKGEQIRSEMARAPEDEVAGLAGQAALDVEAELAADDKPTRKRANALRRRLTALTAVETTEAAAFKKKGQETQRAAFEELMKLEAERDRLQSQLDAKKFTEADAVAVRKVIDLLEPHIKAAEAKIGSASLKQIRRRIDDAEDKRRAAVVDHEIERAEAALASLDDTQAIAVLKAIRAKGLFPEWVWRELVRVTALKLEVGEGENWEEVTPEEKEWKKKRNPVSDRWRVIMKEWKKDVTGWRKRHGEDLSLVVIRAVCNEIAEMSLHARGVKPTGGISQKARWYAAEGSGRSFSRPKSNADLKTGASFFFLEWSDKPPRNKVNVVRSDTVELQNEKGELISDGFKDADGWEYEFNPDNNRVTRKQLITPPPAGATVDLYKTQYLNWTHEAQVVEVDAKRGRVITFETGPIGLRTRSLKNVVNVWHVYIGFAPSGAEPADIDKHLKGILPGR